MPRNRLGSGLGDEDRKSCRKLCQMFDRELILIKSIKKLKLLADIHELNLMGK